ncbi:MAG: hypothetical protein AAGH19_05710 [Pseudomonadota bacterium]
MATCTSVRRIDERTLVCASLVGQRLYLFRQGHFRRRWHLVSQLDTAYRGARTCTDLMDYDAGHLLTSNCENQSVSLYRVRRRSLSHVRDYRIQHAEAGFIHGVAFVPGGRLLCATSQTPTPSVFIVDRVSGEVVHHVPGGCWLPKDIAFLDEHRLLVAYSLSHANVDGRGARGSKVALVELSADFTSHEVLWEATVPLDHIDGTRYAAGTWVVASQADDTVHRFRVRRDGLEHLETLRGFDFPHGVDIDVPSQTVMVTNYGSNTVELRTLRSCT